jgi:hypothetical protein
LQEATVRLGLDLGKILKNYLITLRDKMPNATKRRTGMTDKAISPKNAQINYPFGFPLGCRFFLSR